MNSLYTFIYRAFLLFLSVLSYLHRKTVSYYPCIEYLNKKPLKNLIQRNPANYFLGEYKKQLSLQQKNAMNHFSNDIVGGYK